MNEKFKGTPGPWRVFMPIQQVAAVGLEGWEKP